MQSLIHSTVAMRTLPIIAPCLILLFGYAFYIKNINTRMSALKQQQSQIAYQTNIEKTRQLKITKLQRQLQYTTNAYTQNRQLLQNDFNIADILNEINKNASNNRIIIDSISSNKPPQPGKNMLIYPLDLVALGNYQQLANFNSTLHQSKYPLAIQSFILQLPSLNVGTNQIILFNAHINLYHFTDTLAIENNPIKQHSKNNKSSATIIRDPFALDLSTQQKPNINIWHSDELTFIGTLQQNNKTWAVIIDPLNNIYHVTIGSKIGLNHSKITAITAQTILTTNNNDIIYANN